MGDGSTGWAGENRCPHTTWEESTMLEWRPRLIALVLVVVLVSLVAGISSVDLVPLNWEW